MAINLKKISKLIDLDLSDIPKEDRTTVRKEVGDFVIDEILRYVSKGSSPVQSLGKFKRLKPEYAKDMKGGDANPNLDLKGSLLDSLTSKKTKDGIEVGIFKKKEVPKADGHNNFSGKSTLPLRRFIPKEGEKFKRGIEKGIKDIVDEFRIDSAPSSVDTALLGTLLTVNQSSKSVEIADLFTDEGLESFLKDEGFI